MLSKKTAVMVGVVLLVALNIIFLSVNSRHRHLSLGAGKTAVPFIAPFQGGVTYFVGFIKDVWRHYFSLVSVARENDVLQKQLKTIHEKNKQVDEIIKANIRLRELLRFKKTTEFKVLSAEIIGRDPSSWFKSIIIDKGRADGIEKGAPVVVPEGIVGQVVDAAHLYAKVLLIIDRNNAVDGLVQRTRARGVIKGAAGGRCLFKYALRKDDINVGDIIISSGLDRVFPKGLRVGRVSEVEKPSAGIFQKVTVTPFADFEKVEEVLVILSPLPSRQFQLNHQSR